MAKHRTVNRRGPAQRRGADTRWQVWWPILVQLAVFLLAVSGLYYGLKQEAAVQKVLADERYVHIGADLKVHTDNLRRQLDSLESNVKGLERYIIDLHRQEERRTR